MQQSRSHPIMKFSITSALPPASSYRSLSHHPHVTLLTYILFKVHVVWRRWWTDGRTERWLCIEKEKGATHPAWKDSYIMYSCHVTRCRRRVPGGRNSLLQLWTNATTHLKHFSCSLFLHSLNPTESTPLLPPTFIRNPAVNIDDIYVGGGGGGNGMRCCIFTYL